MITAGLLTIYGLAEPYFLDVQVWQVPIPELPEAWEGQAVAVIADFQLGMWLDNDETARKAVGEIIRLDPAAALILGDFVYHAAHNHENEVGRAVEILQPLTEAGIPTFAVLGNHDYSATSREDPHLELELAERLKEALREAGVEVLENGAAALGEGETLFYIAGLGPFLARRSDAQVALSQVPEEAPRMVIMHNPDSFELLPANTAPLAVAGHTHGGQIAIPFTPGWSWIRYFAEEADEAHAEGWIADFGQTGNRLYVNRGIGFSKIPIRISAAPELTIFILIGGEGEVIPVQE